MDTDYYTDEGEFRSDFHALKRGEIFIENYKDIKDRVQRFKTFVGFVATEIQDQTTLDLNGSDINFLIDATSNIPTPGYKNPTAFILGYILAKKGNTKNVLDNEIVPILGDLSYTVKPYDVVRYARLFLENNLLK